MNDEGVSKNEFENSLILERYLSVSIGSTVSLVGYHGYLFKSEREDACTSAESIWMKLTSRAPYFFLNKNIFLFRSSCK